MRNTKADHCRGFPRDQNIFLVAKRAPLCPPVETRTSDATLSRRRTTRITVPRQWTQPGSSRSSQFKAALAYIPIFLIPRLPGWHSMGARASLLQKQNTKIKKKEEAANARSKIPTRSKTFTDSLSFVCLFYFSLLPRFILRWTAPDAIGVIGTSPVLSKCPVTLGRAVQRCSGCVITRNVHSAELAEMVRNAC